MRGILVTVLALTLAAPVRGQTISGLQAVPGTVAPTTCPQGAGAADNGCAALIAAGHEGINKMTRTAYFGTLSGGVYGGGFAQQNGQTYAVLPTYNVPFVDYGVGSWTQIASMKDPAVDALPSGCTYSATGSDAHNGEHVDCNSGSNPDIEGFNFGLRNGIQLHLKNAVTGVCTVKNNNWIGGLGTWSTTGGAGYFIKFDNGGTPCTEDVESNNFDGNQRAVAIGSAFLTAAVISGNQANTVKYNYTVNIDARPFGGTSCSGGIVFDYNYVQDYGYSTAPHYEPWVNGCPTTATTLASFENNGNTILQRDQTISTTFTEGAMFAITRADSASSITTVDNENNTNIYNKVGGNNSTNFTGLILVFNGYGTVTVKNNWTDNTGGQLGVFGCENVTITTAKTLSGNINAVTGGSNNAFTIVGTCTTP